MDASFVIPVYNERYRLPDTLAAVTQYLKSRFAQSEIIIVEDGSTEKVDGYIDALPKDDRVEIRYLSYGVNRGKGYAVRMGVMESRGNLIAYLDADGATPITEMDRLLKAVGEGADIAFGSRAMPSKDITVEKTVHRFLMGRIFAFMVKTITGLSVLDTQCGFKLIKKEPAHELFSELKTEGFAFDVEILVRAAGRGYVAREIPVNWHDVMGSKVRLFKDSIRMLRDTLRISRFAGTR